MKLRIEEVVGNSLFKHNRVGDEVTVEEGRTTDAVSSPAVAGKTALKAGQCFLLQKGEEERTAAAVEVQIDDVLTLIYRESATRFRVIELHPAQVAEPVKSDLLPMEMPEFV